MLLAAGVLPSAFAAEQKSPARQWALPVRKEGLPNLFKVSDDLYRGAQPTEKGMEELKKMGIKTVINLRSFHSDKDEMKEIPGLAREHIFMKAWHAEEEDIVKFLKIVTDKSRGPFFVHCNYGSDRTGTMVAVYRIIVCGWTKQEALDEMTKGGFGFHEIWENLVDFIEKIDVEKIKKELSAADK